MMLAAQSGPFAASRQRRQSKASRRAMARRLNAFEAAPPRMSNLLTCTSGRRGIRHRAGLARTVLEHTGHRMHHRGDAHGTLDHLARDAVRAQLLFVRSDAQAAAVDRRDCEREQLEVELFDARI